MDRVQNQDDIIREFIFLGNGMKKITNEITREVWVSYFPERTGELVDSIQKRPATLYLLSITSVFMVVDNPFGLIVR